MLLWEDSDNGSGSDSENGFWTFPGCFGDVGGPGGIGVGENRNDVYTLKT